MKAHNTKKEEAGLQHAPKRNCQEPISRVLHFQLNLIKLKKHLPVKIFRTFLIWIYPKNSEFVDFVL